MKIGNPADFRQLATSVLIASVCVVYLTCCGCDSTPKTGKDQPRQKLKMPDAGMANSNQEKGSEQEGGTEADQQTDQQSTDWQQFRGPGFASTTSSRFPLQWDVDQGIFWKQGLPGRGASSPIVSGDRIYLTAYSGFGLTVENAGDFKNLRHHLLCLDRATGKPLWQREITGTSLKQKINNELARHGFASSTPVTDGENVYVSFGVTGVFAFDRDGNSLWQRNVGLNTHYFGSSASPLLHGDLLIVNASLESKTIYALNKNTGAAVWMIPQINECWSMPVIGKNAAGETEMIVSSKNHVNAYNPETGERLWHCAGIQDYVVSVPIIVDGICYLTGGKEKQTMAIRMGGKGDAESQKLWEIRKIGSNVSSPVYKDGRLFIFHDSGVIQVLNAENGEVVTRHRTATKERPYASPLLAGNHLYMPFLDSGISVFNADDKCEEVAVNPNRDEAPLMASIVPSGDVFFYRNDKYLVCVGGQAKPTVVTEWEVPTDFQTVQTVESFNIDPEKGWSRRYMGFLTPDFEQAKKFLLMPYTSVITEEQTTQAREIIQGEKPKYDTLREQFETLQWEELTTPAQDSAKFRERWASLEADTKSLNEKTRILVKNLFPEEQLQQHYRDSKAGVAHKNPNEAKKN